VQRLFLFAHFDRDNIIDPYVIHYVSALAQLGAVIFVSTSRLSRAEIAKVRPYTVEALWRPNFGYDFMSWQLGMKLVDDLDRYDEIVVCNDSAYAPLFPLGEMFEVMETSQAAFWGVTSSCEAVRHIQSYFMAFRRPVLERREFWQFWNDVGLQPSKRALIEAYELGLSVLLERVGLTGASYFPVEELLNDALTNFNYFSVLPLKRYYYSPAQPLDVGRLLAGTHNKTVTLWKELILSRVPMIKIELFRDNPTQEPLHEVFATLERHSRYPVQTIHDHLKRTRSAEPNQGFA
jgi:lipopolysaccharide biosynthesis protein